jgi:hypothetical protein
MVKIPDEKRNKLQAKAEHGRLLGFDQPNTKAYKVLTAHGTVTRSRDIVVNEEFESKVDRDMLDFDDAIAAPPTVPLAETLPPTEPSVGQLHHLPRHQMCLLHPLCQIQSCHLLLMVTRTKVCRQDLITVAVAPIKVFLCHDNVAEGPCSSSQNVLTLWPFGF